MSRLRGAVQAVLCNADIPDDVELPVPLVIQEEINLLPREVQTQLRKKSYGFLRADAVLVELSIRNTWQAPAKKGRPDSKGQKKRQPGGDADVGASQQANKRARTYAQAQEAEPAVAPAPDTAADDVLSVQAQVPSSAAAADAAAEAQAESILHVPETSAMILGPASPDARGSDSPSDKSATRSKAPALESIPEHGPPASQTSLAAAAAAAMGGPPLSSTTDPSALQDVTAEQANTAHANAVAASSAHPAAAEPAKLYDVNR